MVKRGVHHADPIHAHVPFWSPKKSLFQIFLGICIEFFLAPGGAEIVGLPLVLARKLRRLFVNSHFADGINSHYFTPRRIDIALQAVNSF